MAAVKGGLTEERRIYRKKTYYSTEMLAWAGVDKRVIVGGRGSRQ